MLVPRLSPSFETLDLLSVICGGDEQNSVLQFEDDLARYAGRRFALAFPMARSGLNALIGAMGWRDREIIMPAYTCAVVANVIIASGNRPVFVDIDTDTFNMQVDRLEAALSPDTVAIIATHMYGFPMNLKELSVAVENRGDVMIIQDCALALGATSAGVPVHAHGAVALFSFSLGKQISTVEGGALVFDDQKLYRSVKRMRDNSFVAPPLRRYLLQYALLVAAHFGLTPPLYPFVMALKHHTRLLNIITDYYREDEIITASNFYEHLPPFLARLGIRQLEKINNLLTVRKKNSDRLMAAAHQLPSLHCPNPPDGASWSHAPCLVENRTRFISHMAAHGVQVGTEVFNYALPEMAVYKPYVDGNFDGAKRVAREIILLPNHPRLRASDLELIETALWAWRTK